MIQSLQEQYAPNSVCFGCGPANADGLQLKSYVQGEQIIAEFHAKDYLHAFGHFLSGGVIGALLDCHCNWAATYFLMQANRLNHPPCTVTAEYTIKLLHPTSMENPLQLIARANKIEKRRAFIDGEIRADGKITATCHGIFVAVKEGHPAFHRW